MASLSSYFSWKIRGRLEITKQSGASLNKESGFFINLLQLSIIRKIATLTTTLCLTFIHKKQLISRHDWLQENFYSFFASVLF